MAKDKVTLDAVPVNPSKEKKEYDSYELEEAVRTLHKAEEIKADKKLMRALAPMLDKKEAAVKSLSDLRKLSGKKAKEEAEEV